MSPSRGGATGSNTITQMSIPENMVVVASTKDWVLKLCGCLRQLPRMAPASFQRLLRLLLFNPCSLASYDYCELHHNSVLWVEPGAANISELRVSSGFR